MNNPGILPFRDLFLYLIKIVKNRGDLNEKIHQFNDMYIVYIYDGLW